MSHAIIFDCEYLTAPGAMSRMWCGPFDPDPNVAQIGAVKLSLEPGYRIAGTFQVLIKTKSRSGRDNRLDPFFTELTGIGQEEIDRHGIPLAEALERFDNFSQDATLWSWGKDELTLFGISCYVEEVSRLIPANRFGNASLLVLKGGMPLSDLMKTTSGRLAEFYGLKTGDRKQHDALDDAMSVALTLQHLLQGQMLRPEDFVLPVELEPAASG
jgi:DNA polymerase III epsilon subunit-like protein